MKRFTLIFLLLVTTIGISQNPITNGSNWTVTNITANNHLNYPNEITYGPDGNLWITERVGERLVRVSPVTGTNSKTIMLDLTAKVYRTNNQDGLLGFAIHPDLYANINTNTNNYVYLAYTYWDTSTRKMRIERYTYNSGTGTLNSSSATTIIENIPGSNDHNGGRLKIGPDLKLYYTVGDQGFNQGNDLNSCTPIGAQVLPTSTGDYANYPGKILRLDLDGGIPTDNPTFGGIKSHVFSIGHRNPQGIIFAQDGKLYSSEHGPKVDDELNLIEAGKNYGWPEISGYYDDQGYEFCDWSSSVDCADFSTSSPCPVDVTSIPETTSGMPSNFAPPLGTYNSTVATDPTGNWFNWPTIGPSSIDIYEGGLIPNWGKSLLITSLKRGTIYRTKLNAAGSALEDGTYEEFHSSDDRYRDIALDPDGATFYAITDNTGGTSGPSGTTGKPIQNPGVIVKIEYTGGTLTADTGNKNNFYIYPNPTTDHLNISFNYLAPINIGIYTINGQLVKVVEEVRNNDQINISKLPTGIYFLSFSSSESKGVTTIKKLIIHR